MSHRSGLHYVPRAFQPHIKHSNMLRTTTAFILVHSNHTAGTQPQTM